MCIRIDDLLVQLPWNKSVAGGIEAGVNKKHPSKAFIPLPELLLWQDSVS